MFSRFSLQTKIWIALLAVYIIWGSTYLGIRFAIETIPPFLHAAVRFLISGVILYVWRRLAGDPAPTRNQWKSAFVVGSLLLVGGNGILSWAEQLVPSGIAALLVGATPMFLVLLEALRPGGVRPTPIQIGGLLLGFLGIFVLVGPEQFSGGEGYNLFGIGLCLFASFLWANGSIYNRSADLPASSLLFIGMQMLMGSLGLFIVSLLRGEWIGFDPAAISLRSWLGLVYLITFGSMIGFVSYGWLLRNAPISLVATYAYVNPIVAVLLGALFVNEPLNGRVALAALVIIGAVALINTFKGPSNPVAPNPQSADPVEEIV